MNDWDDDYREPEAPDNEVVIDAKVSVQWSTNDVIQQVVNQVSDRVYKDIKPKVAEKILETLDYQVNLAIATMLDTEVQPSDRWGKPTGEKVSIRAMLQRDAEQWLNESVDYQGRKGSDSYGNKYPRIHWIIQEALNGKKDHRGNTQLQQMVVKAAKGAIGDVTAVVEAEVKKQAKIALGL